MTAIQPLQTRVGEFREQSHWKSHLSGDNSIIMSENRHVSWERTN